MVAKQGTTKSAARAKAKAKSPAQTPAEWWAGLMDATRMSYGFGDKPTDEQIASAYNGEGDGMNKTAGQAVAAAHAATAAATARKAENDAKTAETAADEFAAASERVAKDEKAKAEGSEAGPPQVPDPSPTVPLSRDEIKAIDTARQVVAQINDPNTPPLTDEAMQLLEDAKDLPPAPTTVQPATPGASATNPALARNDVDVERTPPFGQGSRGYLQG
jgi:hypothetical protein